MLAQFWYSGCTNTIEYVFTITYNIACRLCGWYTKKWYSHVLTDKMYVANILNSRDVGCTGISSVLCCYWTPAGRWIAYQARAVLGTVSTAAAG